MVEEITPPSLLTELLDLPDQVGQRLQDGRHVPIRRLCRQRGDAQKLSLSLVGIIIIITVIIIIIISRILGGGGWV